MDNLQTDESLSRYFGFLHSINNLTGGYRIFLNLLENYSKNWVSGQTITILDLYCGRGDLSRAILAWAKSQKLEVQILAVDSDSRNIQLARAHQSCNRNLVFDVKAFDDTTFLQAQQFDYVLSYSSLHHLPDNKTVALLKKSNLLAKRGIILSDWSRGFLCAVTMKLFSLFSGNSQVSAQLSSDVKDAYSFSEMEKIMKQAELDYAELAGNIGIRFSISGERRLAMSNELKSFPGLAQA